MTPSQPQSMLVQALEHDYRQLAHDARRPEGFAGFFGSSSGVQLGVKEASERAVLLLRGYKEVSDPVGEQLKASKDVLLKPLELACTTTSTKLIGHAVTIMQKLVTGGALDSESTELLISLLTNVEKVADEGVALKILQACLILLQSPMHPTSSESIGSVISLCFRALIPKGKKNQAVTTAAAIVRQAVAIVLSYVDVSKESDRLKSEEQGNQVAVSNIKDEEKEALIASQKLLEDLIALSSGSPATWIKTPSLPRTFSLEILDFALISSSRLFRGLPNFETSLSLRIIQMLQSQLQDHLDVAASGASLALQNFSAFKATLKCIRTVLLQYHPGMGNRCRSLIQVILKGVQSTPSGIHKIALSQLLRQLLGDPALVIFLFTMFDNKKENQKSILNAMVDIMSSAARHGIDGGGRDEEQSSLARADAVSKMYFSREMSLENEVDPNIPSAMCSTALTVVSLDAILQCMHSQSQIVFHCLGLVEESNRKAEGTPNPASPRYHHPTLPLETVSRANCEALIHSSWEPLLSFVTYFLVTCSVERMEHRLLDALKAYTESIGKLQLREPMDAYLNSLCQVALTDSARRGVVTHLKRASSLSEKSSIGEEMEGGLVLRSKNVKAMLTVFGIAKELANDLGPTWHMILETMYSLDNVFMTSLPTQGSSDQKVDKDLPDVDQPMDVTQKDMDDLAESMKAMFDGTRDMSSEGVVALLGGLRDVSIHHLPQSAQVSQPKMPALNRMVDVLLVNFDRIYDLWGTFLNHVLELVGEQSPQIREAAIEALGKAIIGALSRLCSPITGQEYATETLSTTGGMEHMLLVALEALHNDDRETDVQMGVLRVLVTILQRNGERLTDGWIPVFRLLGAVPAKAIPETIPLGFESLQLIYNDFLASLPNEKIRKCIEVAELYGKQQEDVNVSLTTISLLWNAGDMLSRRSMDSIQPYDSEESKSKESAHVDRKGSINFTAEIEQLLDIIYSALYKLSQDPRPEVRNSGSRTLFAIVSAHGERLSKTLWEKCLWERLFPLLTYSFHMSVTSSKEEAEAALLGKSKGEQVRLLVHHSRNTEQKQWDETVVVCLAGMAKLLRTHLIRMLDMKGIEDGWSELMIVVESSIAGGRKEVALAALNLLGGVLGSGVEGSPSTLPVEMWQRAIRALDVGVTAATSSGCQVPLGVRTELVGLVGSMYDGNRAKFDKPASLMVYRWIVSFCRNPWSGDDAGNPVQPVGMPPVQKIALNLLKTMQPYHDDSLWPDFLRTIAGLIEPTHAIALFELQEDVAVDALSDVARHGPQHGTEALPPPATAQYRFALNAPFLEKAMEQLVVLFDVAPMWARADALADIVAVLGKCMQLRYTAYKESLWRSAAKVFLKLVPTGVIAVDATARDRSQTRSHEYETVGNTREMDAISNNDRPWVAISQALSKFLLGCDMPSELQGNITTSALGNRRQLSPTNPLESHSKEKGRKMEPVTQDSLPAVPVVEIKSARRSKSLPSKGRGNPRSPRITDDTVQEQGAIVMLPTQVEEHSGDVSDPVQAREDAYLELQVLDALTDDILTACGTASADAVDRLIEIIEFGMIRPRNLSIPQNTTYANFSNVCVRKMYVLCCRGSETTSGTSGAQLEAETIKVRYHVARQALPRFLKRCNTMIREFAEETQYEPLHESEIQRQKLEELICILEVLATMTIAPEVADAILPKDDPVTEFVKCFRKRPDIVSRGKERTHLLFVYGSLCSLITCKESRIRDMIRDVLGLVGAELGISMNNLM